MRHLELYKKHSISGCAAFAARVQRGRRLEQVLRKYLGSLWNEGLYETAFRLVLVSRTAVELSSDDVSGGALRTVAGALKRPVCKGLSCWLFRLSCSGAQRRAK
jgi:hypothetical protein